MAKKKKTEQAGRKFILGDFTKDTTTGALKNKDLFDSGLKWLGHALVLSPFEAHVSLDYTGAPGASSGIYYALAFQLGKWEYNIQKADEWIEVSPVHAQYYQLTQKQKEDLEGRIKSGLASAAQAVADLELLLHDKRKYEEMLHYMGYQNRYDEEFKIDTVDISDEDGKKKRNADNHSLKAMFIDQVDFHTGEGISMRSIVSRWPTMISDFMKMDDSDIDPGSVMKKLDISRAEAVVLVTKNKLFNEWKNIFLPEVKSRYQRILELVRSRKKSVEEYKEWLKPYVARHKLIEEGLSDENRRSERRTSFMSTVGHAMSFSEISIWAWKDFLSPEIHKVSGDIYAKKPIPVYDDWTKKNLIFNKEYGLIVEHPWITEEWVLEQKKLFESNGWLTKNREYYSFFIIKFNRSNYRDATGNELEDGIFDVTLVLMSQNVLFAKLLELKAKQEEFNKYIDNLLGISKPIPGSVPKLKEGNILGPIKQFFNFFSMPLEFIKRGPYEREFNDRITKYYLAPMAVDRYVPIVNFIKQKMGYGGG